MPTGALKAEPDCLVDRFPGLGNPSLAEPGLALDKAVLCSGAMRMSISKFSAEYKKKNGPRFSEETW